MEKEAELLKILSEPIRLRLAVLLAGEGEVCVCKLSAALQEPEYKISRHLGLMRAAGLVEARREGTWMHYKLAKPSTALQGYLCDFFQHGFDRHSTVKTDRKLLKQAGCGK